MNSPHAWWRRRPGARRLIFPAMVVVYSVAFLESVSHLRVEAAAFPAAIIVLLLVIVAGTAYGDFRMPAGGAGSGSVEADEHHGVAQDTIYLMILYFFYAVLVSGIGFYPATLLFLLSAFWILRVSIYVSIIISFALAVVSYYGFDVILNVYIPPAVWLPRHLQFF